MFRISLCTHECRLNLVVDSQAMAHTMRKSYKQLCLLLLFVFMGMLIFGSLCYFAEKDVENSAYTSIPESMWWAIQTLTSVGYGDLYPKSVGECQQTKLFLSPKKELRYFPQGWEIIP